MTDESRDWLRSKRVPDRRRDQRPRGGPGPRRVDAELRHRPAHPARCRRHRRRRTDGPGRDGRGAAARPRRRGHRDPGGQLSPAGLDRARPPGDPPGPRRPRRDRPVELGPAGTRRGVRGQLPRPRPDDAGRDLAQRPRGTVHLPRGYRRGAVRLDREGADRAALLVRHGRRGARARGRGLVPDQRPGQPAAPPAVRREAQGRHAVPDRGVGRRDLRGRRLRRCPGHDPRHQRSRAPGARGALVRGALPVARPVVARPDLRDGRPGRVHLLLRPDRGRDRLAAGRDDRAVVHRVHRPRGVPPGARAPGRDRRHARPAVHGSAAHPPQGRAPDPVRGQRRRPGRRRRPAGRHPRRRPRHQRARAPRAASCGRPRSATGSSSRTRRTSCSARTRRPASCSSRTPIERLTGFRPDEVVGRDVRAGHRPDLDARRRRALGARRGQPDRAAGAPARPDAQGRRHRARRDPLGRPARQRGQFRGGPRLRARHRASASASSASCASPRCATATSSSRRPTSSG